jgi:outer membrane lipoprotein-sorting protein
LGLEAKYMLIQVENEVISAMLDEGYWKKVGQSLMITDDGKKYDKITIHNYLVNGAVVEKTFWFDITECFGM